MKKIILTLLGALFFCSVSYAQLATIDNKTDCTFLISFIYVDELCNNQTTAIPINVLPGANFAPPLPVGGVLLHIVGATISRLNKYGNICDTQFITPPPTCDNCQIPGPHTYTVNDLDNCCEEYTATWYETGCDPGGQNSTLLIN
jgi:hypothetical protein